MQALLELQGVTVITSEGSVELCLVILIFRLW